MQIKKGQLIRKMIQLNPIGPWLRVVTANKAWVYATDCTANTDVLILNKRTNVFIPKTTSVILSDYAVKHILSGYWLSVLHEPTTKWKDMVKNKPDLIQFYTPDGEIKIWIEPEEISLCVVAGIKSVRVVIKNIVCCDQANSTR